jgi:hypothetical protein
MPSLILLSWRDIPAQIIAREGRASAKRELPLRFTQAIDAAAMAAGAKDADAYLAEWRRGEPVPCGPDLEAEAARAAAEIEADYPPKRLAALAKAGGWEVAPSAEAADG